MNQPYFNNITTIGSMCTNGRLRSKNDMIYFQNSFKRDYCTLDLGEVINL